MSLANRSRSAKQRATSLAWIIANLAKATLGERTTVDWETIANDYDLIRKHIENVVAGFDDYNTRVRRPGGFVLPNGARQRVFNTATGKANFTVHGLPVVDLKPDQFLMMTIRSHDQFNTSIYSGNDRYRGISNGRRVVFLNKDDMHQANLKAQQKVDLISHFEGEERIARGFRVVPYDIPQRCAATYFPEANVLVPIRSVAEKSNTPASKSVVISIMAPVSRLVHLLGVSLYSLLNAIVTSVIVLLGLMLLTNLNLRGANLFGVFVVLAVSTLAFVGLGLIAAIFPVMSAERGAEATHIFQGSILLVSGVYYPIEVLPRWLQPLSAISPATYTLSACRKLFGVGNPASTAEHLAGAPLSSVGSELLILALMGAVLMPVGLWIFLRVEEWAKRAGKLKRTG